MSNTYGASIFDVIPEEPIRQTCPKEFQDFCDIAEMLGKTHDVTADDIIDDFARQTNRGDNNYSFKGMKKMEPAYAKLQRAFEKATKLTLHIGNVEEGLPGSDLSEQTVWFTNSREIKNPDCTAFEKKHGIVVNHYWHLSGQI
ncbi:MAG: hypothetical protein WC869_00025 [Phycisphaerae bacterium]|jgi:hypothetical protein